jgi:phosphate transport system substrate-binding protein
MMVLASFGAHGAHAEDTLINGAGATFPFPLYSKWFSEFHKANPGVEINYQSIGSGGGIRQLLDKTVDFGASDAPMTDEQLAKSAVPILHIPTVLGAVVISYNLQQINQPLRLSGQVVADIYLGKIKNWDDAAIAALNPGVNIPKNVPILAAYRSDGSGTTAVFTDYLSKVDPEWKTKVGQGTAVQWPTGLGGKGNEGVTGILKQTPGSIGYVELAYAVSNQIPFAHLKNKAGSFIAPNTQSVTAAANGALKSMPKDFRVSITDSAGKDAYPISSFTYLLVYKTMPGAKGAQFVNFLNWAMDSGQELAAPLTYAPLPKAMIPHVKARIREISTQ